MNDFFKDYRIRCMCKDFVTFLARVRWFDGDDEFSDRTIIRGLDGKRYIEKQVVLPIREIVSIQETPIGIAITARDRDGDITYPVPGATVQNACYAITKSQNFVLGETWKANY